MAGRINGACYFSYGFVYFDIYEWKQGGMMCITYAVATNKKSKGVKRMRMLNCCLWFLASVLILWAVLEYVRIVLSV